MGIALGMSDSMCAGGQRSFDRRVRHPVLASDYQLQRFSSLGRFLRPMEQSRNVQRTNVAYCNAALVPVSIIARVTAVNSIRLTGLSTPTPSETRLDSECTKGACTVTLAVLVQMKPLHFPVALSNNGLLPDLVAALRSPRF